MDGGELALRGSIWMAALCSPAGPAGRRFAPTLCRAVWTVGALALVVHVASAFHVQYGWDHGVALRETARATRELTGRAFGQGLYVNYLFTLLWLAETAWWWIAPAGRRERAAWIDIGLQAFFLFILFQGTFVFVRGPMRWLGLALTAVGVTFLVASHTRRRS